MPQSEMIAAKRRALAGQGSTGTGNSGPGMHTKYDPANHATPAIGPEMSNPNAAQESPKNDFFSRFGALADMGLRQPSARPKNTSVAPLTGEGNPHFTEESELKGVANQLASLTSIFANILVEISAQRPSLPLTLDGPIQLLAGTKTDYYFLLDQKRVPCSTLFIYNNTGVTVNIGLSEPATANDIPILNGGQFSLPDAKLDYLSIYSATTQNVSRTKGNAKQAAALIIYAWANPEWRHFWGQI